MEESVICSSIKKTHPPTYLKYLGGSLYNKNLLLCLYKDRLSFSSSAHILYPALQIYTFLKILHLTWTVLPLYMSFNSQKYWKSITLLVYFFSEDSTLMLFFLFATLHWLFLNNKKELCSYYTNLNSASNSRNRNNYPLEGKYLTTYIVYQATVKARSESQRSYISVTIRLLLWKNSMSIVQGKISLKHFSTSFFLFRFLLKIVLRIQSIITLSVCI